MTTAEDYKLSPAEKLQFFHSIFRGDALRFYNAHIKHRDTSFVEAVSIIYGHFSSPNVQQRIKADLSTVRLFDFSKKMGSNAKGLSSLATYSTNRVPQCPPSLCSEANKVEFLKQAVLDQPWARDTLVRISPSTMFQHLYTELANALQLYEEVEKRSGRKDIEVANSETMDKPFIHFAQPRIVKSMAKSMFPGNKEASSCWNCRRRGHVFSKCDKKLDLTRIASEEAKLYSKKNGYRQGTKRVLFELVSGLDNLCEIDDEEDNLESV